MALTRITKGVIKPNENYDTHDINSTGIITATGANITGNMTVGGVLTYEDVTSIDSVGLVTAREGIFIPDSKKIQLGNATGNADLEIVHDTNNSVIRDKGTGSLVHEASGIDFARYGTADYYARFIGGGKVDLRYNGDVKFETSNTGATVTGTLTATGADINGDIDVDGHTNLDNVSIAGITTMGQTTIFTTGGTTLLLKDSDSSNPADRSGIAFVDQNNTQTAFIGKESASDAVLTINNTNTINPIRLKVNNTTRLEVGNAGVYATGSLSATGTLSAGGTLYIPDDIQHSGDADTKIRFPSNDTISFETAGSERLRINSSGKFLVGIHTTSEAYTWSPRARFAVEGSGDASSIHLGLRYGGGADPAIMMLRRGGSTAWHHHVGRIYTDYVPSIYFQTSFAGAPGAENFQTHMVMKHNVGVGIKTDNPGGVLDVLTSMGRIKFNNSGSIGSRIDFANADGTVRSSIHNYGGSNEILAFDAPSNIQFRISNSTKLQIASAGQIGLGGANYGSSGQVLTSGGSGSAPTWTTITGTTINNNADNRIITGSGTANTLNGEATLTYNGSVLHFSQSNDEKIILSGSSNPYIRFRSGSTDKGYIQMHSNGNMYLVNQATSESLKIGSGAGGLTFTHDGSERVVAHQGYMTNDIWYLESGKSYLGNWGQFEAHGTYTNANTEPAYWGWNYSTGNTNFPNTNSGQWYRGRFSLGSGYGKGTDAGDYWMEITVPRSYYDSTAGQMYVRTCENGVEQAWCEVGSRPRNHVIPYQNASIDLGGNTTRWRNIYGGTLSLSSYAVVGSLVVNDPGSSYYSFNNRIGGNTIIKGTTVCTDDIGSTIPSTFPASNVQLMVYTSTLGQPINNTDCARLLIATDAKNVGAQGYHGSLDFGSSDASASTGSAEFQYRVAAIMCRGDADTSPSIGDGDLQFYTKTSSGSLTHRFDIAPNGDLTGTDTSIGNLSDQRLKTNIQDYTYDLNKFKQFKTRTFDWINPEFHQEGNIRGFIAQEIETVDPYWNYQFEVSKETAKKDYDLLSDGDENYTIRDHRPGKASKLNGKDAMYVSVIQQLIAKIETLETKVAALEG